MNEDIQKLREIGATAHGDFLRHYINKMLEERCSIDNLETDEDLKAAKKVRVILKEDILQYLKPQEPAESSPPLVNQFD